MNRKSGVRNKKSESRRYKVFGNIKKVDGKKVEVLTNGKYIPDTVMSIHGWMANGKWQSDLGNELHKVGLKAAPFDYNKYVPWATNSRLKAFEKFFSAALRCRDYEIDLNNHYKRPSIYAHSLGTWILAKAMKKYPEIKFDKIFLFGSIIPSKFDWNKLILRDQVNEIIFERTPQDLAVKFSFFITGNFFPSAKWGFNQKSSFIEEIERSEFGHTDFQYPSHFAASLKKKLTEEPCPLIIKQGKHINDYDIAKQYLSQAIKIDNSAYPDEEYQSCPITLDRVLQWYETEKDIWTFILNTKTLKVDGYINVVPVNEKTYNSFISGEIAETDIHANHILEYHSSNECYLLLLSIAVNKSDKYGVNIRSHKRADLLQMGLIDKILRYKRDKVNIRKMAAVAWTPKGQSLCLNLGMTLRTNRDKAGHEIYEVDLHKIKRHRKNPNKLIRWFHTMR